LAPKLWSAGDSLQEILDPVKAIGKILNRRSGAQKFHRPDRHPASEALNNRNFHGRAFWGNNNTFEPLAATFRASCRGHQFRS
jgi:hypothetical protein